VGTNHFALSACCPYCLNFSSGLLQTLALSTAVSLPPTYFIFSRVSPCTLTYDCSVFSDPQSSSVSNNRPPLKMAPGYSIQDMGSNARLQWISFPVLACHSGGVIFRPDPCTWFRIARTGGSSCG
jgi:hypothetical protein